MLGSLAGMLLIAHAGDLDGEVTVDTLHARSRSAESGAGPDEVLQATELGFRVRLDLHELDDRLELAVDYRDREPVAGQFQDSAIRLLYRGELRYALVDGRLVLGAGRFLAPSPVLTPVDGARLELSAGGWGVQLFGGRRGFSQSRRNLPLDAFLPAAGGSVSYGSERFQWVALGGYSVDRIPALGATEDHDVGAANALSTVTVLPIDELRIGGQGAFTQQATYLLGPAWSDVSVELEAFDLWRGMAWADWDPLDWLGLAADVLHQEVGLYSVGSVDGNDVQVDLQEPRFTDLRGEADVGLWGHGWVRPLGRYRIRHDRDELRYGATVDIDDLGVAGPFLSGRLWIDEIQGDVPDRTLWSGSAGYERGDIEVEGGASFVEREAGPFGSRRADGASGEDLSPFVLEAQQVAFLRGFYSADRWFAGLDLERSLRDPELRIFVQLGALGEVRW